MHKFLGMLYTDNNNSPFGSSVQNCHYAANCTVYGALVEYGSIRTSSGVLVPGAGLENRYKGT